MQPLTQAQAAALAGVSARRLRQLTTERKAPRQDATGQYPVEDFRDWLEDRLIGKTAGGDDDVAKFREARARLTRAQADKTELEVSEIRGEVVRTPLIEQHWAMLVSAMRAKLLAMPSRVAASVAAPDRLHEVTDAVRDLVYEALSEIAGDAIPDEIRRRMEAIQITEEG